jgi:hypothetical protein
MFLALFSVLLRCDGYMSDEKILWLVFVSNLLISVITHVVWSVIPQLWHMWWVQRATCDVPVLRNVMLEIPKSSVVWNETLYFNLITVAL